MELNTCGECRTRGKTWEGDDPKCGFPEGVFTSNNWNCASLGRLREMWEKGPTPGVDVGGREDQNYMTINLSQVDGVGGAVALWVTWYKSRGRTDGAWLLFADSAPRPITEIELLKVLAHYKVEITKGLTWTKN